MSSLLVTVWFLCTPDVCPPPSQLRILNPPKEACQAAAMVVAKLNATTPVAYWSCVPEVEA